MSERLEKIKQKQWKTICQLFDDDYQLYVLYLTDDVIYITSSRVDYNKEHNGFIIHTYNNKREVLYSEIISYGFGKNKYKRKK